MAQLGEMAGIALFDRIQEAVVCGFGHRELIVRVVIESIILAN